MWKLSNRSLTRIKDIKTILIAILVEAISHPDCPSDFGIPQHGGKRTGDEQNLLFLDGLSQKDGYLKLSKHQSGEAFDIYAYINRKASWDKDDLEALSLHIRWIAKTRYNIILIWGGDWDNDGIRVDKDGNESFFDGGHFQIKK